MAITAQGIGSVFLDCAAQPSRMLLLLTEHGAIRLCSSAAARYLGISVQTLIGQSVTSLLPQLPVRQFISSDSRVDAAPHFPTNRWCDFTRQDSEGRTWPLEAMFIALEGEGNPLFVLELRTPHTQADSDEKLQRFQEVSEWSGDAVVITDKKGVIVYVNPVFEALTGYSKDELLGHTHARIKANVHEPEFFATMWQTLHANKTYRGQFVNLRKDGSSFYEDKVIRPFCNANGAITHFIATGRDVSERVQIMRRLEHLANHDGLTGLPNRNLFLDRLQQAQAHASRHNSGFALLLLDLDHFKSINDTYGHAFGDAVLQTAANRLKQCLREEDTVARLGGDEFSLILEKAASRHDVQPVLEKMIAQLHHPLILEGLHISIRASIGIAFYPEHGIESHDLLKYADHAMYRVKAAGGNGHVFFEGQNKIPLHIICKHA